MGSEESAAREFSARERNIRSALVDAVLARGAATLAIVNDRHEQGQTFLKWRDGAASITARQVASAAVELAREVLLAGEVQSDERSCGVEIASRVVCGHARSSTVADAAMAA